MDVDKVRLRLIREREQRSTHLKILFLDLGLDLGLKGRPT